MRPHLNPLLSSGHPALAPSGSIADAVATIAAFTPIDEATRGHRLAMLRFIDQHPDALDRRCAAGHLTGSALVVDAESERILVLFHRKVQRWLQPGGHADGDANLANVALREATEETGITGLAVHPVPIDLDIHRFRAAGEADHDHLDVRFLVIAPADAEVRGNHESEGLRWVTFEDLVTLEVDPGTIRMALAGLSRLRDLAS